ncbi:MAG: glycosyltransferase family 4 protein [Candidatus Magasanikbacteria bacterium]|nr:glycosyltransferase family 4 protein [bacterium]NCS71790.1 glycosyltransferase family 4 protein [Candidatus Magasanikbacteria bacterium]
MNIAMIGQKGMPAHYGGVERHVHDLSVGLVEAGHEVTAYSREWYTKSKETMVEGVHIENMLSIRTKHLDTITYSLIATIDAVGKHFDIIHYHGIGPSLVSWIPRIFSPKTRVITTFHSIDRYHKKWNIAARIALHIAEWTACRFAHETITVSQSLEQYCRNEYNKQTTYIPNGVNITIPSQETQKLKKFGLKKNEYFVMISRLVPHKGAHLLIEAFQKVKQAHSEDPYIKRLKLAIVGGEVYTNDYVRLLHTQASPCNDIVFTDFQSGEALKQLYAHAAALIHPSLNEGLPITVLEAMGIGTPVLVSNILEHLELIHDPRAIFTENDVNAIASAIYAFIQLSKEEKSQMIEQNKQIITKQYSWNMLIPQIIAVYENQSHTKKVFRPSIAHST